MGREGSIESQQKSDFFCSESLPKSLAFFFAGFIERLTIPMIPDELIMEKRDYILVNNFIF